VCFLTLRRSRGTLARGERFLRTPGDTATPRPRPGRGRRTKNFFGKFLRQVRILKGAAFGRNQRPHRRDAEIAGVVPGSARFQRALGVRPWHAGCVRSQEDARKFLSGCKEFSAFIVYETRAYTE